MLGRPWAVGVVIVVASCLLGELVGVVDSYVFARVGLNRDLVLVVIWGLLLVAAFVATYFSESRKLLAGLSMMVVFPVVGTLIHFFTGAVGVKVDFGGIAGAVVTFRLFALFGGILVALGTFLGLVLPKK